MASALVIIHALIFLLMVAHALARPDLNSTTRVAWIFTLLIMPIGGVVLYFIFGEIRFNGPVGKAHRAAEDATRHLAEASGEPHDLAAQGPASGFATIINGFGVTRGNRAELLDSPHVQRTRLIDDIDAAKDFINVFYYIWLDDNTGRSVAAALIRAARRGLTVRAGVDAIGSRDFLHSQTWQEMKDAGIETQVALPLGNPLITIYTRRPDLRNHRKITVIDGRICHCGSQNCADYEFRVKAKYAPWVDMMVRFEGPVARQMDLLFAQCWFEDRPIDLAPWTYEVEGFADGIAAQVIGTGPTISKGVTAQLITRIIGEARREIIITTPYFAPGEVVVDAIMGAALAGVRVILIVPRRNDSGFVGPASRSYYPILTEAGVEIAEFNGGLMHTKTLTVDGELTFMGATNLDIRSLDLNFENDILLRDEKLTGEIRNRQMEYYADSTLIDPAVVKEWPVWKRIWHNSFVSIIPLI